MTATAPPGRQRGAGYRIGATVLVMVGAIFVSAFAYALATAVGAGATSAGTVAGVAMALGILVLGLMVRAALSPAERRLMMEPRCSWGVTIGVALGVALAARIGIGILTEIGRRIDPALCRRINELSLEPTPQMWQKVAVAVALVVLAPLGEELVFRGILLRGLVRMVPFAASAWISGALFGASHIQYYATWPVLLGVGLFGVANAYVYRRYGYRTAVAAHALFNLAAAVFLFVDVSQADVECPT
ncbi:MAG TPA: type II CAAX endopeptidase family protein [Miltoncostaeales bacterium]|nr:type II CAAX endopeptidase family protein [Miltoncostaeales bacterium]